jgi:hypothetical protein
MVLFIKSIYFIHEIIKAQKQKIYFLETIIFFQKVAKNKCINNEDFLKA